MIKRSEVTVDQREARSIGPGHFLGPLRGLRVAIECNDRRGGRGVEDCPAMASAAKRAVKERPARLGRQQFHDLVEQNGLVALGHRETRVISKRHLHVGSALHEGPA